MTCIVILYLSFFWFDLADTVDQISCEHCIYLHGKPYFVNWCDYFQLFYSEVIVLMSINYVIASPSSKITGKYRKYT